MKVNQIIKLHKDRNMKLKEKQKLENLIEKS